MRVNLALSAICLSATFAGCSRSVDEVRAESPYPEVRLFDSGIQLDLGRVNGGDEVRQRIALCNPSAETIEIAEVTTSCACLTLQLQSPQIAAHGRVVADIVVDTNDEPGFAGKLLIDAKGVTRTGEVPFVIRVEVEIYRSKTQETSQVFDPKRRNVSCAD